MPHGLRLMRKPLAATGETPLLERGEALDLGGHRGRWHAVSSTSCDRSGRRRRCSRLGTEGPRAWGIPAPPALPGPAPGERRWCPGARAPHGHARALLPRQGAGVKSRVTAAGGAERRGGLGWRVRSREAYAAHRPGGGERESARVLGPPQEEGGRAWTRSGPWRRLRRVPASVWSRGASRAPSGRPRQRNSCMGSNSVAEGGAVRSGQSEEGPRWDTSPTPEGEAPWRDAEPTRQPDAPHHAASGIDGKETSQYNDG
jgi:hypothetical protein